MKFQVGDRIEAHETGALGNITAIDVEKPDPQVQIKWDNFDSPYWYGLGEVIDELIILSREEKTTASSVCNHIPTTYVGLRVVEYYCQLCNQKLPPPKA